MSEITETDHPTRPSMLETGAGTLNATTLRDGDAVVNGGAYVVYRNQALANDTTDPANSSAIGQSSENVREGYVRRGAEVVIPDWWIQFRYEHFRLEGYDPHPHIPAPVAV